MWADTQTELSHDLEGSGGQEGGLALNGEVPESGGEEAEDAHDNEGDSDPDDLDENVQCPKEEETVQLPGTPGCKSCHYLMVQILNILRKAQVSGKEAAVLVRVWGRQSGLPPSVPYDLDEWFSKHNMHQNVLVT